MQRATAKNTPFPFLLYPSGQDKMALKNLKAHFKKLEATCVSVNACVGSTSLGCAEEQITEAKQEYRTCEARARQRE